MRQNRILGLFGIVSAGLGGAIGFEIFVLMDYAYFHLAGPDVIFALALAGVINLLIMLSYSELGASIPEVGGEYTYIKTAYGKYVAFISGCFRWLACVFGAALAAIAFALQLAYFFSVFLPEAQSVILSQAPLIAAIVVIVYGVLEVTGVKQLGNTVTYAVILVFAAVIVGGLVRGLDPTEFVSKPLLENSSGIFAATVYVFPMFFGMRAIMAVAATAKQPEKNVPRGLLITALLEMPLYLILAVVAVGTISPQEVALSVPLLGYASQQIFGNTGGILIGIAGMAACLSGLGASLSVQSSIARGMSRDGYFPKILRSVHPRFGTHYVAILTGSLVIMILCTVGTVPFLGYAASFGSLFVFALVNLSLMKLRKEKPHMDRPFKTPLYPLTPILGLTFSIALLIFAPFLGDSNGSDALISSIGLTALTICTYYLRMVGRYRLQIAVGGIGIGLGITATMLAIISEAGFTTPIMPLFIPNYFTFLVGIILIIAGLFNFNAGAKFKRSNSRPKQTESDEQISEAT
jgi:APA family basic amino acid/polyamine antiporter